MVIVNDRVIPHNLTDLTGPCNIKRLNGNQDSLSQEEFVKKLSTL